MELQFISELNEHCLLFKTQDGREVIFDKVDFEVTPRESIRLEIQKELRKIMGQEIALYSDGAPVLKYNSFERYQGGLYLVRAVTEDAIIQFEPADIREACQVLLMVLKVIKSFHQEGLVFGGISLGQIKRNKDNKFLLQDPLVMHYLGKFIDPKYRIDSPVEVIRGKTWDEKSDLFSWGVLAFHLLTGEDPFTAATLEERMNKIIRGGVAKPKDLAPKISNSLNNLILGSLNPESKKRPPLDELINGFIVMINEGSYEVSDNDAKIYEEKAKQGLARFQSSERFWWWFRKYGFATIGIFTISVILGLFLLLSRAKPVITAQTKPGEVVNSYFKSIKTLDISLMDEAAHTSKNTLKDIVTNLYVLNRTRQAVSQTLNDFVTIEVSDLKVQYLNGNDAKARYRVDYSLKVDAANEINYIERQDIFNLKPDHHVWRIMGIEVLNEKRRTVEKQIDNGNGEQMPSPKPGNI